MMMPFPALTARLLRACGPLFAVALGYADIAAADSTIHMTATFEDGSAYRIMLDPEKNLSCIDRARDGTAPATPVAEGKIQGDIVFSLVDGKGQRWLDGTAVILKGRLVGIAVLRKSGMLGEVEGQWPGFEERSLEWRKQNERLAVWHLRVMTAERGMSLDPLDRDKVKMLELKIDKSLGKLERAILKDKDLPLIVIEDDFEDDEKKDTQEGDPGDDENPPLGECTPLLMISSP
jgi:hypothetical protein